MNIKSFLRKRRLLAILIAVRTYVVNALEDLFRLIFTKRTILFVTSQKIRSITLGPVSQLCVFITIAWVANLFYQSIQYDKIINEKSQEITRLNGVNDYFETEFSNINEKLHKVNDYLISITGQGTPASDHIKPLKLPTNVNEEALSKADKHTLNQIKDATGSLSDIQNAANTRIKKIEQTISLTGLHIKSRAAIKQPSSIGGQGGPLIPLNSNDSILASKSFSETEKAATAKFANEIDRLIILEKLTQVMPLARPIKSYFISSGFGVRTDPITGGFARHQGLDFVGPNHEKIISPSSGRVVLAGKFSDYGNAVVIDHGFGITTRYGHLSAVKVEKGQMVKKGDVIALQGSTGRSTGQHLHYEVRYKNTPLNPRKFLEAGDALFNDSTIIKHANS